MKPLLITLLLILLPILVALFLVLQPLPGFSFGKVPEIPVDAERLQQHVEFLAGISPPRSYNNVASLNRCADYIEQHFRQHSPRVERQTFTAEGDPYHNLICSFGPEHGPRVVIGAHYDVCGELPGANDNASGTAGLLELARLLHEQQPGLKYRVDLVAYTLEEPPFYGSNAMGSAVHAKSLRDLHVKVEGMLSLEMIGYFSDEKGSQEFPLGLLKLFYPTRGNFIAVVGKLGQGGIIRKTKRHMKAASDIEVRSINAPTFIPGIDFSDHRNYWKQGYRATMVTNTAFYRNKNYHTPGDTPDRLNYEKMAEVVKGVYWAVVKW